MNLQAVTTADMKEIVAAERAKLGAVADTYSDAQVMLLLKSRMDCTLAICLTGLPPLCNARPAPPMNEPETATPDMPEAPSRASSRKADADEPVPGLSSRELRRAAQRDGPIGYHSDYDPSPASLAALIAAVAALDIGLPREGRAGDPLCPCGCGGTITPEGLAMLA